MIYVTGDIHGALDISKLNSKNFSCAKEGDYLIICGDFGLIWSDIPDKNEKYWLNWLSNKPWTTLFVDGNHENFNRLNQYPITKKWGGNVHQINDKVYHLLRGEIYNIDNKKIFAFGGAFSHDKIFRKENVSWWKDELPTKEECDHAINNLEHVNNKVDIIITHDAPRSIAQKYGYDRVDLNQVIETDRVDITSFLEYIYKNITFDKWYCGHYHIDLKDSDKLYFTYQDILKI